MLGRSIWNPGVDERIPAPPIWQPGNSTIKDEPLAGIVSAALESHINATEPHPAYDVDIPRLDLIFENHLI